MKNHVLRPLWLTIALVLLFLMIRPLLVPDDFGVHGRNFTYGYHRLSNIQEWKDFPVKYLGREYCVECHEEQVQENGRSVHKAIQCENCHGPAIDHPQEPPMLTIDGSRELCLRCHQLLDYPNSSRASIPGINGDRHKRKRECHTCHNPHNPTEEM